MFKMWRALAAFSAVGACTLVTGTGTASAATSPVFPGNTQTQSASYGFDGNAHLIVGGGSDTTYRVMQSLADLWGQSASSSISQCVTNKTANATTGSYPQSPQALNQCTNAGQSGSFNLANYDADTVTNADPAGSSAGIESLNGFLNPTGSGTYPYEGTNSNITVGGATDNGYGTPDFARSSRGPTLTGTSGECAQSGGGANDPGGATNAYTNDELACDTFWGFAADGVETVLFGNNGTGPAYDNISLTPSQIDGIWNCTIKDWNQIDPSIPTGTPIVPWAMNTSSGTYATFDSLVASGATDSSFKADNNAAGGSECVRQLANPSLASGNPRNPFENDIKSFVDDANSYPDSRPTNIGLSSGGAPAGLSTSATSTQNPANWIWFSSYGLLSTFPYDAAVTVTNPSGASVAVSTAPAEINGVQPSTSTVSSGLYPFNRTLYYVTPKTDADCPTNPNQPASNTTTLNPLNCDFTSGTSGTAFCNSVTNPNGQPELDVLAAPITYTTTSSCNGASGSYRTPNQAGSAGVAGAVREFSRFICRGSTDPSGTDPFTGGSYSAEIGEALTGSGFTAVPHRGTAGSSHNLVSPGSSCEVLSQG